MSNTIGFKEYIIATWANGILPPEVIKQIVPSANELNPHRFRKLIYAVAEQDYQLARHMWQSAYGHAADKLDGKLAGHQG
jgi:hypothetical protein